MFADQLTSEYFRGYDSITVLAFHEGKNKRLIKRVYCINGEFIIRFSIVRLPVLSNTTPHYAGFRLETDDLDYAIQVYNSIN